MQNRKRLYATLTKSLVLSIGVIALAMSMAWAGPLGVAERDSCRTLRMRQAEVASLKDVMSSIQQNEDGSYTSALASIQWITAEEADDLTRDETPEQDARRRWVCWTDQGYLTCCDDGTCCVVVDGIIYCG